MPSKTAILGVIGIVLQYGFMVLLYYFLFRVLYAIYRDLRNKDLPLRSNSLDDRLGEPPVQEEARLVTVDDGGIKSVLPVYTLGETITIGRGEANEVIINETFVSHEHACIARHRHGFWLTDLHSTNGTFLNNLQVTDEVRLENGDEIRIGAVTFRFER